MNKNESHLNEKNNLLIRMGETFTRFTQKYMPDPTIFAIVLTFIAFGLALTLTNNGPFQVLENWYMGFWELLSFAMQMSLILITGGVVASSRQVQKVIRAIARIPNTGREAAALITLISILTSYIHFGLSIIVSSLIAKYTAGELYKEKKPVSYGLLGAGAYVGMMTWCVGFSNSVGLVIATPGHFLESEMGIIPMNEYLFNPMNITLAVLFVVVLPGVSYLLHPKGNKKIVIPDYAIPYILEEEVIVEKSSKKEKHESVGEALNHSNIIPLIIGGLGGIYIIYALITIGFTAFDLNLLNAIFFFGGILLHGNIANYVSAFGKSVTNASGVIFQFPFYAGIMGIINYSGMIEILANSIVSISTPFTFYAITFISAAIVNMFVPSGGGQWAVQGPIAVASSRIMGASILKASHAVQYGNSVTNMIQPFWALSLLGITGLKAKDVMGYSAAIMLIASFLFFGVLLFLPV